MSSADVGADLLTRFRGRGGMRPPLPAVCGPPGITRRGPKFPALYCARLSHWTRFMPKPLPLPPAGFDDLSVDDKIDYLQSLWDRIAATPETIPVPDWHREILDVRLKDLDADPAAGDGWEVVEERLRKKFDTSH